MALIGAAIVYALWQRHQDTLDKENPVNLPIVADAYVWPTGCDEKIYERGDNISWKSQSSKYYMRSRLKYRFSSDINPKNTSYYYMVGNDAINITCSMFYIGNCKVSEIVKGTFEVKRHE